MKSEKQIRPFHMKARNKAVAKTGEAIFNAMVDLWRDLPIHEITLQQVAGMRKGRN